ncbi:DUF2972 domain-containing protein [Helicobacter aurati]|uniref:DUF2972 domain-containing protein n=1 Tax=Helicobacter aurati TaxID=137778 RepID=A0A3D8J597_9HELI|nr:DUF2972 domain-containing protein [Helicobacter aurati]RDU72315.1 DUF2972 domain-containing protein [Helicobacter aurati]
MKLTNNNTWRIFREKGIKQALTHRLNRILRDNIFIDLFIPLAWQLNKKLPKGYKFLYIASHATGHNAMQKFLTQCNIQTNWHFEEDGYTRYKDIYKRLIKDKHHYNIITLSEYNFTDHQKFFATIREKVPAIILVRDPIAICKSAINHSMERKNITTIIRGGGADLSALFSDCIQYNGYNTQTKQTFLSNTPSLNMLEYLISQRTSMQGMQTSFITHAIKESLPYITKIHYIDMNEITGKRTWKSIKKLSSLFDFLPPQDKHYFEGSLYGSLRPFLPIRFHIPYKNQDLEFICNLQQHSMTFESYSYNITSQVMPANYKHDKNFSHIMIWTTKASLEKLQENPCKTFVVQELDKLFSILQNEMNRNDSKKLTEKDVLEYLQRNPQTAKKLKVILDGEIEHIKQTRPDIIESWRYYLEFEAICKRCNI